MRPKLTKSVLRCISERDLRATVLELAEAHGWLAYCVFDQATRDAGGRLRYARRSSKGFPDLVLVKPPHALFVELKSQVGKPTQDQDHWLSALAQVRWVQVYLWRPADLERIQEILGSPGPGCPGGTDGDGTPDAH